MPKYINADEFKGYLFDRLGDTIGVAITFSVIDEMPTADVVEIVRCKDCKYFNGKEVCSSIKGLTFPTPNDYCSYGKRRETDD